MQDGVVRSHEEGGRTLLKAVSSQVRLPSRGDGHKCTTAEVQCSFPGD